MDSRKPLINDDGEVGDLSEIDPSAFKPLKSLPKSLQAKLKGRPKALVTKERIAIRLSPDVLETFRSSGKGWQTRIDAALKEWLKTHNIA